MARAWSDPDWMLRIQYSSIRLTRDGTTEPVSRDRILRRERGQGNIHFPFSGDDKQYWQPYPVGPYSDICGGYT